MENPEEVQIRRAPKVLPWALTGAAFGMVIALVLALIAPEGEDSSYNVLGLLLVSLGSLGMHLDSESDCVKCVPHSFWKAEWLTSKHFGIVLARLPSICVFFFFRLNECSRVGRNSMAELYKLVPDRYWRGTCVQTVAR